MAEKNKEMVLLRRWQVILALVFGIASPVVAISGAWYSRNEAVNEMVASVDKQLVDYKLEVEKRFVRRDEFEEMKKVLNTIVSDIGEIKGYLKGRKP